MAHTQAERIEGFRLLAYNQSMVETLYKTELPEKERSECYVLVLTSRPASERKLYVFMEEHGYWDDRMEKFIYEVTSISAEDDLNQDEAFALYHKAKKKLPRNGFIHRFVPEFRLKEPEDYRLPASAVMCA